MASETPVDSAEAETAPDQLTFSDLGLDANVLKALKDVGYETPSAIQAATIPVLLQGRDVVGLAQTGTGKTAAFALPVLSQMETGHKNPQALVLAPTRELALQVCEAFEKYAAHIKGVSVLPVYGGQGYGQQLSALRRGVDVIVGTPGRIMDHLDKGTLDLSELKFLVLFSATMPAQIRRISAQYLNDPEEITVKTKTTTSANITQRYLIVSYQQKIDALTRILEVENFEGMIVFTRTKNETETVAEKLRARGYTAAAINGDIAQVQRERTVNQLKSGKLDILVATDVAARGLDVERISHVVNYDLPIDTESYVHRIGRTGRAGRTGDAISFVTPRERRMLTAIEKATRQPLTEMSLPSVDDVNATRLTRFDDAITTALEDTAAIATFRDVVAHYVAHHDVPEADVAAALAVVAQGDTPLLLEEETLRQQRFDNDRPDRSSRDSREGGSRDAGPRRDTSGRFSTYRIAVGRRQRVEPRQIVGALANEGGLRRNDFGAIQIRQDFSLVELPADLSNDTINRLADTRISGQLIDLRLDQGGRSAKRSDRPQRRDRDRD
jgi:ATP-dependent RNA helicase DeaD